MASSVFPAAAGASVMNRTGTIVHPLTVTDDLAVGGSSSTGPIFFDADRGQARLYGDSGARAPLFLAESTAHPSTLEDGNIWYFDNTYYIRRGAATRTLVNLSSHNDGSLLTSTADDGEITAEPDLDWTNTVGNRFLSIDATGSAEIGAFIINGESSVIGKLQAQASGVTVGAVSADNVNIISNANTCIRVDNDSTSGNTRMLVYDVDNATLERVTVGSPNSGGGGFKVLRIPN